MIQSSIILSNLCAPTCQIRHIPPVDAKWTVPNYLCHVPVRESTSPTPRQTGQINLLGPRQRPRLSASSSPAQARPPHRLDLLDPCERQFYRPRNSAELTTEDTTEKSGKPLRKSNLRLARGRAGRERASQRSQRMSCLQFNKHSMFYIASNIPMILL